jgi:hypothetical protein
VTAAVFRDTIKGTQNAKKIYFPGIFLLSKSLLRLLFKHCADVLCISKLVSRDIKGPCNSLPLPRFWRLADVPG